MKLSILRLSVVLLATLCVLSSIAYAIEPNAQELSAANDWMKASFAGELAALPFSFIYDGSPSTQLLRTWKVERSTTALDQNRTQQTTTFSDPKSHLEVKCVMVWYNDYPAVEWTLYFKNAGASPTPILEKIQGLDATWNRDEGQEYILHYSPGGPAKVDDYAPLEVTLGPKMEKRLAPVGGRSSDGAFPYFNLQRGNQGLIIAVGWPGQWAADFNRDLGTKIHITAGQERTHFKLLPGEEVRSPLTAVLFYEGNWIRAQNIWRRWIVAHNIPRPGGNLPKPQLAGGSCPYYGPFVGNTEENQKLFIRRYLEEGIKLDNWWIDAGWYPNNGKWTNTGTWEVDAKRFPNGLKAVSDYAHAHGANLIVWFEPERVTPGTWLYEKHPEWLLKVSPTNDFPPSKEGWRLLNLGDPAALKWVTDHVDKLITDNGIDTYRQDFNMQALPFWRANDTEDRQGITENRYVTGYLAYWDELRRRHPNMILDDCASGGRRNDLESMRRAVPLWRSDYIIEPVGMQNQTYGISFWLPYEGLASQVSETEMGGAKTIDAYTFRSDMFPSIHAHWDVRRTDLDYNRLRQLVDQWRAIAANYMGDYYPLTPYSTANDVWIGWQFNRPETGEGHVQAFRRPESSDETARLKLYGLSSSARYKVTNADVPSNTVMTGQELMEKGLLITLKNKPDSALYNYKRVDNGASD